MTQTSIHDILDELAQAATDHRDKGDKFERLIKAYLSTDPLYVARFSDVWLWNEWPERKGKADTGIDLVARERDTGVMVAIQCKFYAPTYILQKGDIDSFFTASGKAPFAERLIVSTTDKWSKHAEDALVAQQIPVVRMRVQDLDDSSVDWSKFSLAKPDVVKLRTKKRLRKHQTTALKKVEAGFAEHDRGKLIMACGTGKTFTSLKIVEHLVPEKGLVLFLVPSISLLSQSLKEWTAESEIELRSFAVCSDTKVGKHSEDISAHDLAYPATTDAKRLIQAVSVRPKGDKRLTVIFSTYQSIQVISDAQKKGLADFDMIICDEAHRTTGVTLSDEDESAFKRVHDAKFLKADKRLYMTATPRLYSDDSKSKAEEAGAEIASMDDETKFGPEFHRLGFGEAVSAGLLSDYKVMVLAVDEKSVSRTFQSQLADGNNELTLDDAVKIVGCWNGLSKRLAHVEGDNTLETDPSPMRRAVAFAKDIKSSQKLANQFETIVDSYIDGHDEEGLLRCQVDHVDGTYNVLRRNERLDWLKADTSKDGLICRILSNARCLSEGVDVPALDAVLFLNPRDSVVDVVQSVGRVMRKSEGKTYGYIILPVGIPADLTPEEALKDNKRYKVVWQVLQALRAHDDRFNALINKIDLNSARDDHLQVIGVGGGGDDGDGDGKGKDGPSTPVQVGFAFPHLEEWRNAIYAKIVQKCGNRRYWEQWAGDVVQIFERHTTRIKTILKDPESKQHKAFDKFLKGLHTNINPSITKDDAIEMLSQHLITKPVFDALFEGYAFAEQNPVSRSMEKMLKVLEREALDKETEPLDKFYDSVRMRAAGIDNAEGKQKIIIELYEKFFRAAFKKMTDRLGIVYTPTQVVDFIIRSADVALRQEFGKGLSDQGVHILDPFTGTGTFMVRLLQSGLIGPEDAKRKYNTELHANELVLLAYYIAAINIEEAYHGLAGGDYQPFDGIVLTDTFQMTEGEGESEEVFPENNQRVSRQKKTEIRVIIGNPPYSAQQDSENDGNKNINYPALDNRIRSTYAKQSNAGLLKNLYDSYVRSIRWASDRIKDRGIVCFVSNGSFIDANNMDGLRKCFAQEFSKVYVFNLRGNQRTSGEQSRQEGGKIFGSGSRASIAITLLVKNPEHKKACELRYHDIGDYLSREQKLEIIAGFSDINNVPWKSLEPNEHGDWTNQRDPDFGKFMAIGDKDGSDETKVFDLYSLGVVSNRDAWVYNFSRAKLAENMTRMIGFYNEQRIAYSEAVKKAKGAPLVVEKVINADPTKISWTHNIKEDLKRQKEHEFDDACVQVSHYRPFTKVRAYFNRRFNERVYQMPKLFPGGDRENVVFAVTGLGATKGFSTLISKTIVDLEMISKGQCFPLYIYDQAEPGSGGLFDGRAEGGVQRRDAITDRALSEFRAHYKAGSDKNGMGGKDIAKEDIFYYVYGLLHSPEYRKRFEFDLKKVLPRVPLAKDFWAFSQAGRDLASWHLNYESVEPFELGQTSGQLGLDPKADYRVAKMRFGKSGKEEDKSVIVFNNHLTLTGIPSDAYDYVVNGKSAIEWVMERYQVVTDKDSGIVNDPNDWSDDPMYIVNLIKRVVRVSVETVKIVRSLPALQERKG